MIDRLLGPLQHRIMKILWTEPPLTVHDVIERLSAQPEHPVLAYTTVLTVCRNLTRLGATEVTRGSRSHLFSPCLTEPEYHEMAARFFVESVFGHDHALALKVVASLK